MSECLELEKRISAMERIQDRTAVTLDQINSTLKKFEAHIDELFEAKSKLDSIGVMWRRIDELQAKTSMIDTEFKILSKEHNVCKPMVDSLNNCKTVLDHKIEAHDKRIALIEKHEEDLSNRKNNFFDGMASKVIFGVAMALITAAFTLAAKGLLTR